MRILPYFNTLSLSRRCIGYVIQGSSTAWLELLICAAIIAILTATAAGIYRERLLVARVEQVIVGLPMAEIKTDMMVYHAHTGRWPDSLADLQKWPALFHDAHQSDPVIQALTIEGGAMQIVLNAPMRGGTVTVRPGVPKADPLGPVAWYAGRPLNAADLSLAGEDRTTIPQALIHPRLR
jgi:Tfp pilus assembly protein PilE